MWNKVRPDRLYQWIFIITAAMIIFVVSWVVLVEGSMIWLVVPAVLMIGILYTTIYQASYAFQSDYLELRLGLMTEKIKYHEIKSIRLVRNLASSMAVTYEKIEIRQHGKGYITGTTYCSSADPASFIEELKARCDNLN
jgi:hypothetical protein